MNAEMNLSVAGVAGTLQLCWQATERSDIGLIVCHPHPLFQGSMDNKVVTTIARAAASLGLPTLRFNFRGVGQSAGLHDRGVGEQDDVLSVIRYATEHLGWQKIILAGFSFGSGMACLAACREPQHIKQLILVAPPVHHFDAPAQLPHEIDTYIYYGDQDEVVPVDEMAHWVELVLPTPELRVFAGGSHFFHGKLADLQAALKEDFSI